MADPVTTPTGDNVVSIQSGKKRGRPPGSKNRKAGARGALPMLPPQSEVPARDAIPMERAPSFGHNEPDQSTFLQHVQKIRRQQEKLEAAKLVVKSERGILKDIRTGAREAGLVMRELDEALEALNTEQVDLIAREKRRRLYMEWLGLELGEQAELNLQGATNDDVEAKRWRQRGYQDGVLGKVRANPEGCPPERLQDYLGGHDEGQEALMRKSPLTRGAFEPKPEEPAGEPESAPPEGLAGSVSQDGSILVLQEADFATGTLLEDANLKTMLPRHRAAFEAAESVVALFGTKRRILKEAIEGGYYVDDGEPETPIDDPEPVADETAPASEPEVTQEPELISTADDLA